MTLRDTRTGDEILGELVAVRPAALRGLLAKSRVGDVESSHLPPYKEFLLPTLKAIDALGGTARASKITAWLIEHLGYGDDAVAVEYPGRPGVSVLADRMAWARSYDKLGGVVETPERGLYVLTVEGKRVLALPETEADVRRRDGSRRAPGEVAGAAGGRGRAAVHGTYVGRC